MKLALVCAPAIIFFVFCYWKRPRAVWACAGAALLALVSACGLLWVISTPGQWRDRAQISWIGVRASQANTPLIIGGNHSGSGIGWPHPTASAARFSPELTIANNAGSLALTIHGIGGFVEQNGRVLNGVAIDGEQQLDGFGIRRTETDCQPCVIQIIDANRNPVTGEIELRKAGDYGRAVWLPQMIEYEIRRLRSEGNNNVDIGGLRRWASNIYLYVGANRLLALSPSHSESTATVQPGSEIEMVWPLLRMAMTLDLDDGRPRAIFRAPFRHSSPLLPETSSEIDISELRLGSYPSPGTAVFLLPFGHTMAGRSASVQFRGTHFLDTAARIEPLPNAAQEEHNVIEKIAGLDSLKIVTVGPYDFYLAVLHKIPPARHFAIPAIAAWLIFLFGLYVMFLRLQENPDLVIRLSGISLVVWCLACVRMALAYRFALDPITIDSIAITGITVAILFWVVVPALPLVAAATANAFRSTASSTKEKLIAASFPVAQAMVCVLFVTRFARREWPDLPPRYFHVGAKAVAALFGIALVLSGIIFLAHSSYRTFQALRRLWPFRRSHSSSAKTFNPIQFWSALPARGGDRRRAWKHLLQWGAYILGMGIVMVVCSELGSGGRAFQQIAGPALLFIPIVAWWLSLRVREIKFREIGQSSLVFAVLSAIAYGLVFAAAPIGIMYAMGDVGGIVAVVALFIPVAILLLRKPLWPVWIILIVFLAVPLLLFGFAKAGLGGGALNNRVLVFRKGVASQEYVWNSRAAQQQEPSLLRKLLAKYSGHRARPRSGAGPAILLANAEQHLWSNSAWAYEGGLRGTGFGNSPTRASNVPQDTLQADSAYSFYIANEHGVIGGVALLLLYLTLVLFAVSFTGGDMRWGDALGVVLMAALFLEAASHIFMNLGWIPFTGRDLPLVSVNSGSDFMRALVFLTVAAIATQFGTYAEFLPSTAQGKFKARKGLKVFLAVTSTLIVIWPLADLTWVHFARSEEYPVHDFSEGLARLEQQLEDPDSGKRPIHWDAEHNRLEATDPRRETYLAQEVARFNEMPVSQRLFGGTGSTQTEQFEEEMGQVENRNGYVTLMRKYKDSPEEQTEPTLFVVNLPDYYADVSRTVPADEAEPTVSVNKAFNRVTIARRLENPAALPHLTLAGHQRGNWHLHGDGFDLSIPDLDFAPDKTRTNGGIEQTTVIIGATGRLQMRAMYSSALELRMRCANRPAKEQPGEVARFRVQDGGLIFTPEKIKWDVQSQDGRRQTVRNLVQHRMSTGDVIISTQSFCGAHQTLTLGHTREGSLIGPAWVMGQYQTAYQPNTDIPWLSLLRTALEVKYLKQNTGGAPSPSEISLDGDLQAAAQHFLSAKGPQLHAQVIQSIGRVEAIPRNHHRIMDKIPPRIGIAILRLSDGQVLAVGGWPRVASHDEWDDSGTDVLPPSKWLDLNAPRPLARHYEGDRNFEPLVVGSASKPIWAAAALATNPRLSGLSVRGDGSKLEHKVFNIDISEGGFGYKVWDSTAWCNLDCYLAHSDNRFQVTLNFAALARTNNDAHNADIQVDGPLPGWTHESFNGSDPWQMMPDFSSIGFSGHGVPRTLDLDRQTLATELRRRFGIYVKRQARREYRFSFWSGDENNDPLPDSDAAREQGATKDPYPAAFRVITPAATNLELDTITYPRQLVSVLLGGQTNMWPNVELAAAFAATVTGQPLLPHIVPVSHVHTNREQDSQTASRLLRGLGLVVAQPTRGMIYQPTASDLSGLREFAQQHHLLMYAKTGTLDIGVKNSNDEHEMSRFLLLLTPDVPGRRLTSGLVISVFIERAEHAHEAARHWAQEFILDNENLLLPYLR